MLRVIILSFLLSLSATAAFADSTSPACFTFYSAPEGEPIETLQQIADTCPINDLAELYRRRAEHVALIRRYSHEQATLFPPRDDFNRYLESHRIYIALLEMFARHYDGDIARLIASMNEGYRNELALTKLRLQGYQQRAQWMEWIRTLPKNGVRN